MGCKTVVPVPKPQGSGFTHNCLASNSGATACAGKPRDAPRFAHRPGSRETPLPARDDVDDELDHRDRGDTGYDEQAEQRE
jgi:hypothetical protein